MKCQTSNMEHLTYNKIFLISFFIICGILFFSPVLAEESPSSTEDIVENTTTTPISIEGSVDIPTNCEVVDTDGVTHSYGDPTSSTYFAICAIKAAQDAGIISNINLSNQYPSMGLFVTAINDVEADPMNQYWALFQNDGFASLGISSLPIEVGDTLKLELQDFVGNNLGSNLTLHINSLLPTTNSSTTTEFLATTTIHLQIETYDNTLFNDDFVVTACEPTENTTSTSLTVYCALQQLSANMGWTTTFSFYSDSVFLSSINNYDGADWNWWAFFHNLDFASEALNEYIVQENDDILLSYGTFPLKIEVPTTTPELNTTTTLNIKEFGFDLSWNSAWLDSNSSTLVINDEEYFTENGIYELEINTTTPYEIYGKKNGYLNTEIIYIIATSSTDDTGNNNSTDNDGDDEENTSSGGSTIITHNNLNINKAIEFLSANQNEIGNFGSSDIYTDWVAIAFGSYNKNHETAQNIKSYLITDPNPLVGMNDVSDYARRSMALIALGINPYSDTATNYINKLIEKFDGTQFGDPNLYNDDIFAIIPLLHAGYNYQDEIISKTVNFILSKQTNGGWGSVDLTAATIQALSPLTDIFQVSEALLSAKNKLKDTQTSNGGWGNIPSTAWVMQAISSSGENQEDWQNNNITPDDYLYSLQASDGGLDETNTNNDFRIWNTAYAIPASLKMDWNDIMQNFTKPTNENSTSGLPDTTDTTTTTPTSTIDIIIITPTSTPTSTIEIEGETATTTIEIIEETCTDALQCVSITNTIETDITNHETYNPNQDKIQNIDEKTQSDTTRNDNETMEQFDNDNNTTTPTSELVISNQTLSSASSSTPIQNTAKGVFATATAMASGLGLYLGWRFLLSLV